MNSNSPLLENSTINNYASLTDNPSHDRDNNNLIQLRKKRNRKQKQYCIICSNACTQSKVWCSNCVDWRYIGNTAYDSINIFITVADIITDTLVIYNFYTNQQMTFFWIGLTIVIIAQICYAVAFVIQYVEEKKRHPLRTLLWFIVGLIFSPFMSFIFFLTSDQNRWLSKIFEKQNGLRVPPNYQAGDTYTSYYTGQRVCKKKKKRKIKNK